MNETNVKKPAFSFDSIVIDCQDAESLADFYARLLGWHRRPGGDGWAAVSNPEGTMNIYFQTEPDYVPPVWPAKQGYQQMMVHLDFAVDDLDAAVAHALSCGARLADTQSPITWKGSMNKMIATWTAPSVEIGLELFNYVRERIFENKSSRSE